MSETRLLNKLASDADGPLPERWREAALSDVSQIRVSNVDKKSNVGEIPVRLCNYLDVYKNQYITADLPFMEATATPSEIAHFAVEVGDVMITKDSETPDDIGVSAVALWSEPRLVCGYHLALIKPDKNQVDPIFLAKQLRLPRIAAYYGRLACGSTRYGLSHSGIGKTPLRMPSLPEQAKVARILTTLDNLIAKTEALITKYQAIKQGMMYDLFTRGMDEYGQLRPSYTEAPDLYQQSEFGWIPKKWDVKPLGDIATITKLAGFEFTNVIKYDSEGEIIAIRALNIKNERLDLTDIQRISRTSSDSLPRSKVYRNDVLITYIGAQGLRSTDRPYSSLPVDLVKG